MRNNYLRLSVWAMGCFALLLSFAAVNGQTTVRSITFGGVVRSYRIYVPANYTGTTAVPLVFNLHGYTSNALQQEFYSGMNAVADTAGFLICYPDGIANSWNSGFTPPYYGGVDDVGFISTLIDELSANYNINPARVYSTGMSNGGFMSYRLACDLEDRIAAIASVTGSMTTLQLNNCQCNRSIPILEIHGTNDATVPYTTTSLSMGIDSVLNYWRQHNGCSNAPIYDTLPDLVQENSTVTTQWYGGCNDNVEVAHYKIENGGHTWPGAFFQLTGLVTNMDIKASVEIWNFFNRFSHPSPVLTSQNLPEAMIAPRVMPQPSQGHIHIQDLQVGASIQLLNLQGQHLGTWTADGSALDLDARSYASGIYLLHINQGTEHFALKIVVSN